jgi:hypothetical protein
MKKQQHLRIPFLVLLITLLYSCSNEIENVNPVKKSEKHISYNDLFSDVRRPSPMTRSTEEQIVETTPITTFGYDQIISKDKRKVFFNYGTASKLGIAPGIYLVENLLCIKKINIKGYDFWEEDSPKCGYKPIKSEKTGVDTDAMSKERGYAEPISGTNSIKTYVIHIICDISGRKYDKYDPCPPEKIQWDYSISPM